MERLTERLRDVLEDTINCLSEVQEEIIKAALSRFAAYEGTGLEPEEMPTGLELANVYAAMLLLKRYQALGTVEELTALVKARDEGRVLPEGSGWFVTCNGKKLTVIMDINAAREAEAAIGGGGDGS